MTETEVYHWVPAEGSAIPLLLSSPHSGEAFPPEVQGLATSEALGCPDADRLIHQLYGFAPSMGATMIHARYSRSVVDLNRNPEGRALYDDGRAITEIVPKLSFAGKPLWQGELEDADIAERIDRYFKPYHQRIHDELEQMRRSFDQVMFFDAHSIRRHVPSIRAEPFPDLILGDNDGQACSTKITDRAEYFLRDCGYQVTRNHPFKGGYLTRSIGAPGKGIHALQLEMSQDLYLSEDRQGLSPQVGQLQNHLKQLLEHLVATLGELG